MNLCRVEPLDGATLTGAPAPVLVLGLGNDILTDDLAGLLAARELAQVFRDDPRVRVCETTEMGLALLDWLEGHDAVVLVDAVLTGRVQPGELLQFSGNELDGVPGLAPHGFGVGEVLAAGRELGLCMPRHIQLVAVEVQDPFSLGAELTPQVASAMPRLVSRVQEVIRGVFRELSLESREGRG